MLPRMCGRFTLAAPEPALRDLIGPADWSASAVHIPRWNIAPGQDILAVTEGPYGRKVEAVRWGFPAPDRPAPLVNARVETAATRGLFRRAFAEGRCVVPADAFYEWHGRGGAPYRVVVRDGRVFGMAAIRSEGGGLAILTMAACRSLAAIHDRMPVVLGSPAAWRAWLAGEGTPTDGIVLASDDAFRAHPVSRRVNSVLNDDAECAAEAAPEPTQGSLF
jgi:putative SOS response-associated peptidase YedK